MSRSTISTFQLFAAAKRRKRRAQNARRKNRRDYESSYLTQEKCDDFARACKLVGLAALKIAGLIVILGVLYAGAVAMLTW